MKKRTIVMLCVGAALLFVGSGIFFLTWSMGAVGYEGEWFRLGFQNRKSQTLDDSYFHDERHYDEYRVDSHGGRDYESKTLKLEGENAHFTELELRLSLADTIVTQDGSPGYIRGENFPKGKLAIGVEDGTLIVEDLSEQVNFGLLQHKQERTLVINLPPQIELQSVKLVRGVGDVSVNGLSASSITVEEGLGDIDLNHITTGTLTLSVGAGDCTLNDLTCTEGADIERGMGEVELNSADITGNLNISSGAGDCNISSLICTGNVELQRGMGEVDVEDADIRGNLNISGGAGECDISGSVKGNISLDAGMGDCDFKLIGSPSNYFFTLHKGMGDIVIDDMYISSKQTTYGTEQAPYTIDLQGGAGDIEVEFTH